MKQTELDAVEKDDIDDDIRFDASAQRAGRWATAVSILGVFTLLILAAFADLVERKLGIPKIAYYVVAGATGVTILLLNWGIENMSKRLYGLVTAIFLAGLTILMAIFIVCAYLDSPGLAGPAIMGGLYLVIALVAWRLKVLVGRV